MPYIGNNLATQFQAFATQTITGDGSTSYTLDRAVANGKELLVYINNVKQEEGSGKSYEASGTTITFSEAVASGDSCYLVYMGSAQQTVTAPAGSIVSSQLATAFPSASLDMNGTELILDADGDTSITADTDDLVNIKIGGTDVVSINSSGMGIGNNAPSLISSMSFSGTSETLVLGDTSNAQPIIQLLSATNGANTIHFGDGTGAASYRGYINYNHSTDAMELASGGALGLKIDASGHVTKPLQPAFLVDLSSRMENLATNSTASIQFNSEKFDVNGDFNTSNYTFTAPVTGKYQFNFNAYLTHVQNDTDYYYFQLDTSNRNYIHIFDPRGYDQDLNYANAQLSVLADMDASDTAKMLFYQINGTAALDIIEGDTNTYFSGHLVC